MFGLELTAIGPAKDIWDMLIGLLRENEENKLRFLDRHVEPLQARLLDVHKDYVATFQEIEKHLREKTKPSRSLLEFLRERKRNYDHEHTLVVDLASEIGQPDNARFRGDLKTAVGDYCSAILGYFGVSEYISHPSWYTYYIDTVEKNLRYEFVRIPVWDNHAISGDPGKYLLDIVEDLLDHKLPEAFGRVSEAYAKLRRSLA